MSREVGGHRLIVGTRLVKDLEEFNGELSLEGLHFWRTVFSAMTHPATTITQQAANVEETSSADKKVILLPCRNPPSRKRLELWLEAQKQYKSLRNVGREEKGLGLNVEVNLEGIESKTKPCDRLSNIRRQKRHMSLVISSMRKTMSPSKCSAVSPISDGASMDVKKHREMDDDDDLAVPLDSLELPSWLQRTVIIENQPVPSSLSPLKKNNDISPLCVGNKEEYETSPDLLNSTPINKQQRNRKELEPLFSTPISDGKELSCVKIFFSP